MRRAWAITKLVIVALVTAVLHFVLVQVSMVAYLGGGLGPMPRWTWFVAWLWMPLGFPASVLVWRLPSGSSEQFVGAYLDMMLGTSALWGIAVALLLRWWQLRKARRSRAVGVL